MVEGVEWRGGWMRGGWMRGGWMRGGCMRGGEAEAPSLTVEIEIFCASDFCKSVYGLASGAILVLNNAKALKVRIHIRATCAWIPWYRIYPVDLFTT